MSTFNLLISYGGGILIPAGAIVPYISATAPSGWTLYTAADGMHIVGAGSTYTVNTSVGNADTSVFGPGLTSSAGAHTGTGTYFDVNPGYAGTSSAGAHTHTPTVTYTRTGQYRNYCLIKSNASQQLPSGARLLSASNLSGLTQVETGTTDAVMRSNSGSTPLSLVESWNPTGNISTDSQGNHAHGTTAGYYSSPGNMTTAGVIAGAHTHTGSATITMSLKRYALMAFTNASANFDVQSQGIVMWESLTPPSGWALCNGTNGTPDLRDYFIVPYGTAGLISNSNSMSFPSTSVSNAYGHSHLLARFSSSQVTIANHGGFIWSHSHTVPSFSTTNLGIPASYALAFIMKL